MSKDHSMGGEDSIIKRVRSFLLSITVHRVPVVLFPAILGFAISILSLTKLVDITPSTRFGESIEGVAPVWYWLGIALIIVSICYMLTRFDAQRSRIPFLLACIMLIFSMRSVLAIISPFPAVGDTWKMILPTAIWRNNGLLSPIGLSYFSGGYVRGWPTAFILAYLITSGGVPVYLFYQWAPTAIFVLDLVAVYFLFKELANEKIGTLSAFLFALLNTNGFFPLHYCPQALGALLYLVAMSAIVKAYKTRKPKHLAMAFLAIFAAVVTHHMTTFFLGVTLAGAYIGKYLLKLRKAYDTNGLNSSPPKPDTLVKLSLPISIFTFALWYFYGFVVYGMDARLILTKIMQIIAGRPPEHKAGYYGVYLHLSPLSQLSIIVFPAFILATAAVTMLRRLRKKESMEGYLWFVIGWIGALSLPYVAGHLLYGNYIEPLRAQEIITIALYPASALLLLRVFESKSLYLKCLITIVLISVAFFSVFSIYRAAQSLIYFYPSVEL